MAMSGRLGAMLVSSGLITEDQLQKALAAQKNEGGRLGSILVKMGFVQEDKLMTFLSKQYGVPYVDLGKFEINPVVIKHIPSDVAQKYRIMPINRAGATITIAMVDPSNIFAIDDIKFMTGYNVEAVVATEGAIVEAVKKYYGGATKALVSAKADAHGKRKRSPWMPKIMRWMILLMTAALWMISIPAERWTSMISTTLSTARSMNSK